MFKSPIELLNENEQRSISQTCSDDLQLDVVYNNLLGKDDKDSNVRRTWLNTFTTNTTYLKETQKLLDIPVEEFPEKVDSKENIVSLLNSMRNNPSFKDKYEYITIEFFEKLNHNELMLQAISIYTLSSPILSLITPFIMIFIPFFALRVMGKPITLSNYMTELKRIFSMLPIGKLFDIGNVTWDQRGLIFFSVILYFVQIYNNTRTCYKFYMNSKQMVSEIHDCGNYCNKTAHSMRNFVNLVNKYKSYTKFSEQLVRESEKLSEMAREFLAIKTETFRQMGKKMKLYYDLYKDGIYSVRFNYSFDYLEYVDNMRSLANMKALKECKFTKSRSKCSFKNSYYCLLKDVEHTKNSYSLSRNGIISGPNASGKTTMLKTTMINIILSQQIGKGFYNKATIKPFDYLHCYINIPDTCGRDSLFQAEARRCREIIDIICNNSDSSHLCVFDELFSGTNPYEAVACAYAYLKYLNKNNNITYLLTTHYLDLCRSYEENNSCKEIITNYTMGAKYNLQKGISKIKGGIKVIEELNFPEEIITTAKKMVR